MNPEQTTVLYDQALTYADLKGDETVIDAYCGTGTISLFLAHKAKHVIGIEIVEPAIINARENAQNNGYDNTDSSSLMRLLKCQNSIKPAYDQM